MTITAWFWHEFVVLFQIWFNGHIWHLPVWSFQYGVSALHLEQDFVSTFHIGRSGGHTDVNKPLLGWGCIDSVIFWQTRVIGFNCCPAAHITVHKFLTQS